MALGFKRKKEKKGDDPEDIFRSEDLWDDPSKKGLLGFFRSLSYVGAAVLLSAVSLVLLLTSVIISAAMGGEGGLAVSITGFLAMIAAIAGLLITLYGKFILKSQVKISWLAALIPGSILSAFLLTMYIVGAVS